MLDFGFPLEEDEINWLIANKDKSKLILDNIFNYSFKSDTISNWVEANFNNMDYSDYMAKSIG